MIHISFPVIHYIKMVLPARLAVASKILHDQNGLEFGMGCALCAEEGDDGDDE